MATPEGYEFEIGQKVSYPSSFFGYNPGLVIANSDEGFLTVLTPYGKKLVVSSRKTRSDTSTKLGERVVETELPWSELLRQRFPVNTFDQFQLLCIWTYVNHKVFKGKLKRPKFKIGPIERNAAGKFEPEGAAGQGTLRVSDTRTFTYMGLTSVVAHEMIHQYLDLTQSREDFHGPTFLRLAKHVFQRTKVVVQVEADEADEQMFSPEKLTAGTKMKKLIAVKASAWHPQGKAVVAAFNTPQLLKNICKEHGAKYEGSDGDMYSVSWPSFTDKATGMEAKPIVMIELDILKGIFAIVDTEAQEPISDMRQVPAPWATVAKDAKSACAKFKVASTVCKNVQDFIAELSKHKGKVTSSRRG